MSPRRVSYLSYDELVTEARTLRREIVRRKGECLDAASPCTPRMNCDPDMLCAACASRYYARKLLVSLARWRDEKKLAQVPVPPKIDVEDFKAPRNFKIKPINRDNFGTLDTTNL